MKDNIFLASFISPHTQLLGSEFQSWDPDTLTATMRFTVKRDVITARGGVQGGLVAGYLDDVMGYAHVLSTDGELAPLTLELSMSLLKPVREGPIIGKGRVVKAGRRVIYLEGELLSEDGEVLARATSTNIPTPRPTGADMGTT
ncbi:MAG: PaaI family thioesterase [Erythrobacter sp.]|nr:PaaI family thioesterase [Erythrobacter sp.]